MQLMPGVERRFPPDGRRSCSRPHTYVVRPVTSHICIPIILYYQYEIVYNYTTVYNKTNIILLLLLLLLLLLRKVQRGLKWKKTSPGGPQRENRRAAIRR